MTHYVEPQISKSGVELILTCDFAEGAPCRMRCDVSGCDGYGPEKHEERDQGRCLVVEWSLKNELEDLIECYSGLPHRLEAGPIEIISWRVDTLFEWQYEAAPVNGDAKLSQNLDNEGDER